VPPRFLWQLLISAINLYFDLQRAEPDAMAAEAIDYHRDAGNLDILATAKLRKPPHSLRIPNRRIDSGMSYYRFTRRYLGHPSQWGGSSWPKGWPRKAEQIVTSMCAIHCPTRLLRSQIPLPTNTAATLLVVPFCLPLFSPGIFFVVRNPWCRNHDKRPFRKRKHQ
jgi:hypothetical protein